MPHDLLGDIGLSIAVATGLAFVARGLRQPLILAYIAAGVVLGSQIGFGVIDDDEAIKTISETGLILLLFIIGLEIDVKKLVAAGRPVMFTGLLQVPVCLALGPGFFTLLAIAGFPFSRGSLDVVYLAAATSLSSTMIVVKLLYDKQELDTLAGRITVGVLIFHDLWAILFVAFQTNLRDPQVLDFLLSVVQGAALVGFSFATSRYVLPILFRYIARTPELVLLASLAWVFVISGLADLAGLSRAMGRCWRGCPSPPSPTTRR